MRRTQTDKDLEDRISQLYEGLLYSINSEEKQAVLANCLPQNGTTLSIGDIYRTYKEVLQEDAHQNKSSVWTILDRIPRKFIKKVEPDTGGPVEWGFTDLGLKYLLPVVKYSLHWVDHNNISLSQLLGFVSPRKFAYLNRARTIISLSNKKIKLGKVSELAKDMGYEIDDVKKHFLAPLSKIGYVNVHSEDWNPDWNMFMWYYWSTSKTPEEVGSELPLNRDIEFTDSLIKLLGSSDDGFNAHQIKEICGGSLTRIRRVLSGMNEKGYVGKVRGYNSFFVVKPELNKGAVFLSDIYQAIHHNEIMDSWGVLFKDKSDLQRVSIKAARLYWPYSIACRIWENDVEKVKQYFKGKQEVTIHDIKRDKLTTRENFTKMVKRGIVKKRRVYRTVYYSFVNNPTSYSTVEHHHPASHDPIQGPGRQI